MTVLPGDRTTAAILASFAGDSLALGAHWEYDAAQLERNLGRVTDLLAPSGAYHAGKQAGDFTHYGDQALLLLEYLAETKGFAARGFAERWQAFMADYAGYRDNATKTTLQMFEFGIDDDPAGANSQDLAGASRLAPLLALDWNDVDEFVAAARAQTRITHNNGVILDCAEFLARAAWHAAQGADTVEAMHRAAGAQYASAPIAQWVEQGEASASQPTVGVIGAFGQSCHADSALPGVAHLLAKYPQDLETALVECVMAGGDSAARAMAAGMVLGAALGPSALPARWTDTLKAGDRIAALLKNLGK